VKDRAARVVVIDDDVMVLRIVARMLERFRFEVLPFESARRALAEVDQLGGRVDLILSDVRMPDMDGLELLRAVRERWPELPVVMMTGDTAVHPAIDAIRMGAYDYLLKPFDHHEEVVFTVTRAVERRQLLERNRMLEQQLQIREGFEGMVGVSAQMREVFEVIQAVGPTDAAVLLLGESGTGKELVARAVHAHGVRRERPFIPVNCSALAETLLESELFGHVRGAFSGATTSRVGLFEEASGGTLFLDEIGDVSPGMQVRLLRVLQEGEIKPVGSTDIRRVDVRVIAATNRDLMAAVSSGAFRQDLYYRLNVVAIEVPPLRERGEDIPLLVHHFLRKYASKHGRAVKRVDPEALELLQSYRWPGNVRELENVVQRAVVLAAEEVLTAELLPQALRSFRVRRERPRLSRYVFTEAKEMAMESFERSFVEELLLRTGGNVAEAARQGGLDKSNFRRLVKRRGIDVDRYRTQ
jgi:DNA-binding NtrC family response regulator